MNLKIAIVLFFAFIAASQASFVIINTYANENCTNDDNVLAKYYTNAPGACSDKKRFIEQVRTCSNDNSLGVFYDYDYTFCTNYTIPSVPSTWQVLQLSTESTCNATADQSVTSFLAAPRDFSHSLIAFYSPQTGGLVAANTSLSCTTAGNLTVSTCLDVGLGYMCFNFDLENNMCAIDSTGFYYGLQTTCVAVPVAAPVAVPETSTGPVASSGPAASPVNTPVKAPSTKTSSASAMYGFVALLSLVALL